MKEKERSKEKIRLVIKIVRVTLVRKKKNVQGFKTFLSYFSCNQVAIKLSDLTFDFIYLFF